MSNNELGFFLFIAVVTVIAVVAVWRRHRSGGKGGIASRHGKQVEK